MECMRSGFMAQCYVAYFEYAFQITQTVCTEVNFVVSRFIYILQ